jgi:hypothetical protein
MILDMDYGLFMELYINDGVSVRGLTPNADGYIGHDVRECRFFARRFPNGEVKEFDDFWSANEWLTSIGCKNIVMVH